MTILVLTMFMKNRIKYLYPDFVQNI